jgi:hypothetical protein
VYVGGFCWSLLGNSVVVCLRVQGWGCHGGGGGWVGVHRYMCGARAHSVHVGASYVKMSLQ